MEDQQPATGHLTLDAATKTSEAKVINASQRVDSIGQNKVAAVAAEVAWEQVEGGAVGAPDGEAEPEATRETATTIELMCVQIRRLAGKGRVAAVAVAVVPFVASAAFAGATLHSYLTDRAAASTRLNVARTAATAVTTLWTYTPENMDSLADRAATYLSGDFEAQYRKFVDAIVAPNKQAKITNSTQVAGAAVESLNDPNAAVIVYANITSTSPLTKNIPALKYLSYRLLMKRTNGRWLVTRMATITTLDLTLRP